MLVARETLSSRMLCDVLLFNGDTGDGFLLVLLTPVLLVRALGERRGGCQADVLCDTETLTALCTVLSRGAQGDCLVR
jgi:hypothetical protein